MQQQRGEQQPVLAPDVRDCYEQAQAAQDTPYRADASVFETMLNIGDGTALHDLDVYQLTVKATGVEARMQCEAPADWEVDGHGVRLFIFSDKATYHVWADDWGVTATELAPRNPSDIGETAVPIDSFPPSVQQRVEEWPRGDFDTRPLGHCYRLEPAALSIPARNNGVEGSPYQYVAFADTLTLVTTPSLLADSITHSITVLPRYPVAIDDYLDCVA